MRDAGIEVIYGVEGLKVHSKLTHIKTTSGSYAVIGTGNFHEGNARSYTDVLLFTARPELDPGGREGVRLHRVPLHAGQIQPAARVAEPPAQLPYAPDTHRDRQCEEGSSRLHTHEDQPHH